MVSPFTTNPFEQQTQSFLQQIERDRQRRQAAMIQTMKARREAEQLARERAALNSAVGGMMPEPTPTPEVAPQGFPPTTPPPDPTTQLRGVDIAPSVPKPQFGSFFGSGLLENAAEAGLTVLKNIEPGISTAVGMGARLIPGDQEFDKQFREVMEERAEQGKGAGLRQFMAAGTEAARRADPLQRMAEITASTAMPWLNLPFNLGISNEASQEWQDRKEQYFKEETGEDWNFMSELRNLNAGLRAGRRAYQDTDLPKYYKGTMEFVLDPLILIGPAGKGLKAASVALGAGKAVTAASTLPGISSAVTAASKVKSAITPTTPVTALTPESAYVKLAEFVEKARPKENPLKAIRDVRGRFTGDIEKLRIQRRGEGGKFVSLGAQRQRIDDIDFEGWLKANGIKDEFITPDVKAYIATVRADLKHRGVDEIAGSTDFGFSLVPISESQALKGTGFFTELTVDQRKNIASNALNSRATNALQNQQASKVQEILRKSFKALEGRDFGFSVRFVAPVINAITPRTLANVSEDFTTIGAERLKHAFIVDDLSNKAAASADEFITQTSARSKDILGDSLENNGIINFTGDLDTYKMILRRLDEQKKAIRKTTTDKDQLDLLDDSFEIAGEPRLHFSDVVNRVVGIDQLSTARNRQLVFKIDDSFKKQDNLFWQNGQVTDAGELLIQHARFYGEMAKSMMEAGVPVTAKKIVKGKTVEVPLDSMSEITKHFMQEGAYASRHVLAKTKDFGIPQGAARNLEKYFDKDRLLNANQLIDAIDAGKRKYVTPDDTIYLYAQNVGQKIADSVLQTRLEQLAKHSKAFQTKYGVGSAFEKTVKEGQRLSAPNKYGMRELVGSPEAKDRLYGNLVFQDTKLAQKFAKDYDIYIKSDEPFWRNIRNIQATGEVQRPLRILEDVGRISRLAGTGFDFGLPLIYGPGILGKASYDVLSGLATANNTKIMQGVHLHQALAHATKEAFIAISSPENVRARLYKNADDVQNVREFTTATGTLSRTTVEIFEARNAGGPVSKILGKVGDDISLAGKTGTNLLNRFESGWSTFVDQLKLDTYKALKAGAKTSDEQIQLAQFIEKATGTLTSRAVGVRGFQRQLENTFLFFSPRMTRSILALTTDAATRGGAAGANARQAALAGWGALQGYTWAIGEALGGESVNLDPTQPHYLQIKIGDDWVGPGSNFVSVPRAIFRTVAGPDDQDALYREYDSDGGYKDQDWFRLIRERATTAPVGSVLMDAISGEDYFGEPYEGLKDFSFAQSEKLLPFWAQDVMMGDPYRIGPRAVAAEFVGLRTRANSPHERRRLLLDQATAEMFPGFSSFNDLDPLNQRKVYSELDAEGTELESAPEYKATVELINERRRRSGVEPSVVDLYYQKSKDLKDKKQIDLDDLFQEYELKDWTPVELRKKYSEVTAKYRDDYDELYDPLGEYKEALEYLTRKETLKGFERPEEVWIETYLNNVLFNEEFEKESAAGLDYYDYDGRSEAEQNWVNEYGPEAFNYVQEYMKTGKDLHPVLEELYVMRERYKYYGDAPRQAAMEMASQKFNMDLPDIEARYEFWNTGNANQKLLFEQTELIKYITSYMSRTRKALREENLGLDAFLFRFGYAENLQENHRTDSAQVHFRKKPPINEKDYISWEPVSPTSVQ